MSTREWFRSLRELSTSRDVKSMYRVPVSRNILPCHDQKHGSLCQLQTVALISALALLSESTSSQRLSQTTRDLRQQCFARYEQTLFEADLSYAHVQIVTVAVTGEGVPATVSTRRALLQTGPALLGTKPYYNLLRCCKSLVLAANSLELRLHFGMACRHAFDAASEACPGCWVQKG